MLMGGATVTKQIVGTITKGKIAVYKNAGLKN